jgi:uncharacterized protein YkwD
MPSEDVAAIEAVFEAPVLSLSTPAADIGEEAAAEAPAPQFVSSTSIAGQERLNTTSAIARINEVRRTNGVQALVPSAVLMEVAAGHTADMASHDRVSHLGSDGADFGLRLKRAGYDALVAEENLSGGQRNFSEALEAWMASPAHRKRLLSPRVTEIGLSLVYNPLTEYRTFWALVLADPY